MHPSGVRQKVQWLIGMFALAGCASIATAHDYWIELTRWQSAIGQQVGARLMVGEKFVGEPRARKENHLKRFWSAEGSEARPIAGEFGAEPAGTLTPHRPGVHVIAYESQFTHIELEGPKFTAYLKEEGLDEIIAQRARAGEADKTGRERYARCCKALLRVGTDADSRATDAVGLPLEIVPLTDPTGLLADGVLTVRVLKDGAPASGLLVRALHRGANGALTQVSERTNPKGEALLPLKHGGVWLIATVRMDRAPDGSGADWQSLWASLTFETPAPKSPAPDRKEP